MIRAISEPAVSEARDLEHEAERRTVVYGDGIAALVLQWTDPPHRDPVRLGQEMLDQTLAGVGNRECLHVGLEHRLAGLSDGDWTHD